VTLYDEIGGAAAVRMAVTVFYRRVLNDPALASWFADVNLTRLRAHQQAFLTAAMGGPDLFTGRDMAVAHAGLAVTDEAFDRIVSHLAATLRDLGVAPAAVTRVSRRLETLRAPVVGGADEADTEDGAADEDGTVRRTPVTRSEVRPDY
jgi:hemoglobin